MFADEIRRLPEGSMILIMTGTLSIRQHCVRYYSDSRFAGMFRHLPGFPPPKPVIRSVEEASARIKAAGHVMKSKLMGGWSITNPTTGKATSIGNDGELIAYAEALYPVLSSEPGKPVLRPVA